MPEEKLPYRILNKAAQMFGGSTGFSYAEMAAFFLHELNKHPDELGPVGGSNREAGFQWWLSQFPIQQHNRLLWRLCHERYKMWHEQPSQKDRDELAKREVLLSLTGPQEVKRPEDGTPSPLFLSLHRDSTFTDMTYLTRQVFTFSCHSWRTFLPGSIPVTIQYSNLIANALGHLSLMDRWNPEVMLGRIGKTRWML